MIFIKLKLSHKAFLPAFLAFAAWDIRFRAPALSLRLGFAPDLRRLPFDRLVPSITDSNLEIRAMKELGDASEAAAKVKDEGVWRIFLQIGDKKIEQK